MRCDAMQCNALSLSLPARQYREVVTAMIERSPETLYQGEFAEIDLDSDMPFTNTIAKSN